MRRRLIVGFECAVIVGVILLGTLVLAPSTPSHSPYSSVLSDLSLVDSAFAAGHCQKKMCAVEGVSSYCLKTPMNVGCGTPVRQCHTYTC